jgi:hypothetical protein
VSSPAVGPDLNTPLFDAAYYSSFVVGWIQKPNRIAVPPRLVLAGGPSSSRHPPLWATPRFFQASHRLCPALTRIDRVPRTKKIDGEGRSRVHMGSSVASRHLGGF